MLHAFAGSTDAAQTILTCGLTPTKAAHRLIRQKTAMIGPDAANGSTGPAVLIVLERGTDSAAAGFIFTAGAIA